MNLFPFIRHAVTVRVSIGASVLKDVELAEGEDVRLNCTRSLVPLLTGTAWLKLCGSPAHIDPNFEAAVWLDPVLVDDGIMAY